MDFRAIDFGDLWQASEIEFYRTHVACEVQQDAEFWQHELE